MHGIPQVRAVLFIIHMPELISQNLRNIESMSIVKVQGHVNVSWLDMVLMGSPCSKPSPRAQLRPV